MTYWTGTLPQNDDFGKPYGHVMYDAKTILGPWANMRESSFLKYGIGTGPGLGQRYELQPDGRWLKTQG